MSRRGFRKPDGWTRLSPPGRKVNACWRHDETGWLVRHCGHPTALYPYYAVEPEREEEHLFVTHNALGFADLTAAFEQVEDLIAGRRSVCHEEIDRHGFLVLCISRAA